MRKYLSVLLAGALLSTSFAFPAVAAPVEEELVSPWAAELVERAGEKDLMPECLEGLSLKENITRAQFAAVCVKLYEAMSLEEAELPVSNPFVDTEDPEVLKAYELGVVTGMTVNHFGGDELLTREQAATMLTSVYKAQRIRSKGAYYLMWLASQYSDENGILAVPGAPGYTGTGGSNDPLQKDNYGMSPYAAANTLSGVYQRLYGSLDTSTAAFFADHVQISDWARDSVYFMEQYGIVNGVGNNFFKPQDHTQAQAALVMAIQMLENVD